METALSLPFTIDPYGKVQDTTDQSKIWSDRVRAVVGTNLRERVMYPDFGTLVGASFMETDETAEAQIITEVQRAFTLHLDLLKLQSVTASFDPYLNTTNVSIIYDLPNNEQVNTTVSLASIDTTTPIYEENL
jgi:phage baseplate assembly protein W